MSNFKILRNIDCDETADVGVARPCRIKSITAFNNAAAVVYLKLYNTAVAATVGTTVPVLTIGLNAKATVQIRFGDKGVIFDTGFSPGATTGIADNDTGAPAANDVSINVEYDA